MGSEADRPVRVERLTAAARHRSAEAEARARRAIIRLSSRKEAVNFRRVAEEAGVSTSFLYSNPQLRQLIGRHRGQGAPQRPPEEQSSAASLRTKLAVVVDRVRQLEAANERLAGENAALRGELIELRRRRA